METELISVIVPVYNVERYLRRCVDSILHQTYRNLEVLLVDDGSTDASGAICDEYAAQEERVTAVHQKNGGLSAARNAGLERAQGTYLCFVDSDDFLDSRMLETLCRDLQEQNADVAVVGFRMFEREEELAPAELTVPVQCMTGREAIRNTLVSDELGDFAWNKLYKEYLGLDVPSDREGCLQDSHWSFGGIGYFPSYALGSAYGAQMLSVMEQDLGDVFGPVANGDLSQVTQWLRAHIHRYASFRKPGALFREVCGEFDPKYYTDYLTKKYTALYGL